MFGFLHTLCNHRLIVEPASYAILSSQSLFLLLEAGCGSATAFAVVQLFFIT
jgi:hypothetical protein